MIAPPNVHLLLHDQTLGTGNVFEFSILIAMLVSALIAWGLVALSRLVFAPNELEPVFSSPSYTRSVAEDHPVRAHGDGAKGERGGRPACLRENISTRYIRASHLQEADTVNGHER